MGIYERKYEESNQSGSNIKRTFSQTERHLYGSSRLGDNVEKVEYETYYYQVTYIPEFQITLTGQLRPARLDIRRLNPGNKNFELTNHLGNVMAVVSDKRSPVVSNNEITSFNPDVRLLKEYYPFGMEMTGSILSSSADYRFGFQGQEKVDEWTGIEGTSYDFGARIYDARIGRWLACDQLADKYPNFSSYSFAGNSPIKFLDPNGKEIVNAEKEGTAEWKKVDAAIKVIKRTDPKLYNELHSRSEKIMVSLGKLNPENFYGMEGKPSSWIEYGLARYEFVTNPIIEGITNIKYDGNNEPLDAQVLVNMSYEEQEILRDNLRNQANGDLEKYYELVGNTSFNKAIADEEASDLIKLKVDEDNIIANIVLDRINGTNRNYSGTLAHELGHVRFAINNTVKAWIWSSKNLGDPNAKGGQGHDTHNPNGKAAEEAEIKTRKNF